MADPFASYAAEMKALIKATWTDIDDTKLFTSVQALKRNIVEEIDYNRKGDSSYPAPPYAILDIGEAIPSDEFGVIGCECRCPIKVWRIELMANRDNQAAINSKLQDMRAAFETTHTYFQAIEPGAIDSGVGEHTLEEIIGERKQELAIGVLWFEPGVLVYNSNG